MDILQALPSPSGFLPHGQCLLWEQGLLWLHVLSDALIAMSYYSIPVIFVYFVRKRPDLPFQWVFLVFSALLIACGTTHAMGVWTIWQPAYWLDGTVKMLTAGLSVATAFLLVPIIPKALSLPSPSELEAANRKLLKEIEERQRIEKALRASEERFRSLAQCAYDAIISTDSRKRILFWNKGAGEIFGYRPDEVLGLPLGRLIPDLDRERRGAAVDDPASFVGKSLELQGLRKDGSEFPLELSMATWTTGDERFYSAILRDISERKAVEAHIKALNQELSRRTVDLEVINKELEAFTHSVSHDLRAPLRHVTGFIGMLEKHLAGTLDERGSRLLKTIAESAERMGLLIEDLLAFCHVGRSEMIRKPVNLGQLVREVRENLSPDLEGRDIQWNIKALPDVLGDPSLLRQVVANLLSNAVKYTRHRKKALIEVGIAGGNDDEVAIFVRDNGVGFDMQYAHRLFGVFQRLHRSDEFEGTGIGLANVRRIIHRHGGRTWAEGTVDGGATFYFSLPRAEQKSGAVVS